MSNTQIEVTKKVTLVTALQAISRLMHKAVCFTKPTDMIIVNKRHLVF